MRHVRGRLHSLWICAGLVAALSLGTTGGIAAGQQDNPPPPDLREIDDPAVVMETAVEPPSRAAIEQAGDTACRTAVCRRADALRCT